MLLTLFLSLAALSAQAQMMDLGVLPNGTFSQPGAVSGNGSVVVGQALDASQHRWLFRWSADKGLVTFASYAQLGGANASNWDGSVIAGSVDQSGAQHAFRWDASGGLLDLGTLGGQSSEAWGISSDGSVVVGGALNAAGVRRAFRWSAGQGMEDLGGLSATGASTAFAISADGRVVVGSAVAGSNSHAVRWDSNGIIDLGTLNGSTTSAAQGVNGDGSVVVGTSGDYAFRWTAAGGMTDLGSLGGTLSQASDVSADGRVVVGTSTLADGSARAYRWTAAEGMRSLGVLSGGSYSEAQAISDNGEVIVGRADNGQGAERTFIWKSSAVGQVPLQDLSNLQQSVRQTASRSAQLLNDQAQLTREVAAQTCVPGAEQRYCLGLGAGVGFAHVNDSDRQGMAQAGAGVRLDEHLSMGASVILQQAPGSAAREDQEKGLALWLTYQQNAETGTGWRDTISLAASRADNRLQRGDALADVQRSETPVAESASAARLALAYGIAAGHTLLSPELALSHVDSQREGYHEQEVALPLEVDGTGSAQTYATLALRSSTPLGLHGSLELCLATDVLLDDNPASFEGRSQIPGLNRFASDDQLQRRNLLPAASAAYRLALNRNSSLATQLHVSASAFEQQHPPYGLEVQYRYAF
ncbi:hypothetical protein [Pseudomonas sp. TE3786]